MNFLKKHNSKIKILFLTLFVFLGTFRNVYAGIFPNWDELLESAGNTLLWLSSQILAMAGILFNLSLEYTLDFKKLVEQTGMIDVGWTVIRDMGNMAFIFVILFLSIGTILGLSKYNIKNSLKNIILAALLINFSLFFTRVVIDTSNVVAVGFYNATIANTNPTGEDLGFHPGLGSLDKGVSGVFSQALNLHTIYDGKDITKNNEVGVKTSRNVFTIAIFGSLFLLITAFVFLTAAILLIVRVVYLMFLMMISPIAFIGLVLPGTRGHASKWWKTLLSQAFFAPIYLMFIYITATAINSEAFKMALFNTGDKSFSGVFTGNGMVNVIFTFIFLTAMMLASIVAAKSFGAAGANVATKYAGKAVGTASFGAAGRLGRNTVGRWAKSGAEKLENSDAATTWGGKMALKTLRNVGDRSFDARNAGVVKNTSSLTGVNLGDGLKQGYATKTKEKAKAETNYAQSLKGTYTAGTRSGSLYAGQKRSEIYGKKIQDRGGVKNTLAKLMGDNEADQKTAKNLTELPKLKTELKQLRATLQAEKDELARLNRVGAAPATLQTQRDTKETAEDAVKDKQDEIQRIKDSLK